MHSIRNKWARSFLLWTFTEGANTTSRAESVNSLIKRYVNSGSEVVDFIQFIIAFEKKLLMKSSKSKIISHSNQYDQHPSVTEMGTQLFGILLTKHFDQFTKEKIKIPRNSWTKRGLLGFSNFFRHES